MGGARQPRQRNPSKAYLQDTSTLAADGTVNLGNAFSIGGTQDLAFRYRTTAASNVVILVQYSTTAGVAGDYNSNGTVDAADYVYWRNNRGPGSLPNEGGISPGFVDDADYAFWRSRFGLTAGSGSEVGKSTVPEPGSVLLGLFATAAGMLFGTRRR